MQEKKKWELDVAVLCIFFARPDQFQRCFEQVRKARPQYLLLWQDGPRKGRADDVEKIAQCRDIAENIDWECEVYRNYHEENMGCDPSTFNSHQWAFSIVDKCIVLEDDLVPSQSFFRFCKEMLDKYEDDTRIERICGTNMLEVYEETPYDYLFARRGHSWGWASWRRVAQTWNRNYEFLEDEYTVKLLMEQGTTAKKQAEWLGTCQRHKNEGVPYWEEVIGARALLHSGLIIFPKVNLIKNVGLDENSTHTVTNLNSLTKRARHHFTIDAHELSFPLKEPPYVLEDRIFADRCQQLTQPKNIWVRIGWKVESIYCKLRTGTFLEALKRHFAK